MIEITSFRDNLLLTISAIPMGYGLCVALSGGDKSRIGAVALGQPRPVVSATRRISAITSVLGVVGRHEDHIARMMAARLASILNVVVSVSCGIPMEGATEMDVEDIRETVLGMTEDLIDEITLRRRIHTAGRNALAALPLG